eukprot:s1890_g7.t1
MACQGGLPAVPNYRLFKVHAKHGRCQRLRPEAPSRKVIWTRRLKQVDSQEVWQANPSHIWIIWLVFEAPARHVFCACPSFVTIFRWLSDFQTSFEAIFVSSGVSLLCRTARRPAAMNSQVSDTRAATGGEDVGGTRSIRSGSRHLDVDIKDGTEDEDAWDEEGKQELNEDEQEENNEGENSNENNENGPPEAKETTASTEAAKPEGGSQGSNGGDVAANQGGGETKATAKPAQVKDSRTEPEEKNDQETKEVKAPQQAKMQHEESKEAKKHEEPNKDEKHEETKEDVTHGKSTKALPNKNNQEGQEGTPKDASASSSSQNKQNEEGKLSPPGDMPLATDNTDTLPVDICLTATPPSREAPLSPSHCADSKRQCFQQTGKDKKDVETEKGSKKEADAARQPEANVVQKDETQEKKTAPEQKTKPQSKKESEFSTSDAEEPKPPKVTRREQIEERPAAAPGRGKGRGRGPGRGTGRGGGNTSKRAKGDGTWDDGTWDDGTWDSWMDADWDPNWCWSAKRGWYWEEKVDPKPKRARKAAPDSGAAGSSKPDKTPAAKAPRKRTNPDTDEQKAAKPKRSKTETEKAEDVEPKEKDKQVKKEQPKNNQKKCKKENTSKAEASETIADPAFTSKEQKKEILDFLKMAKDLTDENAKETLRSRVCRTPGCGCVLNVYWVQKGVKGIGCGVTSKKENKDVAFFGYKSMCDSWIYAMAAALKSADLFVTFMHYDVMVRFVHHYQKENPGSKVSLQADEEVQGMKAMIKQSGIKALQKFLSLLVAEVEGQNRHDS